MDEKTVKMADQIYIKYQHNFADDFCRAIGVPKDIQEKIEQEIPIKRSIK